MTFKLSLYVATPVAAFVIIALLSAAPQTVLAQDRWLVIGASVGSDDLERVLDVSERAVPPLEATGAVVMSRERASALLESEL